MTALAQVLLLAPVVLAVGMRAKAGPKPAGRLRSPLSAFRSLLGWGAVAAAVGAPWYAKSYVYTLNPVYPFFYNLFPHTRWWNAEIAAGYAGTQGAFGIGHAWSYLPRAPWDLLALAERFTDFPPGHPEFALRFSAMGALFLALAPAALLLRRRDRVAEALLLYTAAFAVLWFKMSEQTRYLMPVFPLLALVAARAYAGLAAEGRIARFLAAGLVGAQVCIALMVGWRLAAPGLPVLAGREAPRDFLLRGPLRLLYPACEFVNTALPSDAKVMMIREPRGFYLDRDYLWGDWGHHARIPWPEFRDEREMRAFVRNELGITHVLLMYEGPPWKAQEAGWARTLWEAMRAGTLRPIYGNGLYWVFAVEDPGERGAR